MANSTLLQLVQQATGELGLTVPSSVIGNASLEVVQFLRLANGIGRRLSREFQWQYLTKEYRFTTVYYEYTGTTTEDSTSVTGLSSTTGLTTSPTSFMVTGTGINQDTYLASVDAGTSSAVLSQAASQSGTVSLLFSQTKYDMPSDFDRLVDRTDWDKTQHWPLIGPETQQQWAWLKSGYIASSPLIRFMVMGNTFQIWPPQNINAFMGFTYVSQWWVLATGGTAPTKAAFTVDTDTSTFPDALLVPALKKGYMESKGFDTTALKNEYDMQLGLAKAHDAGSPNLSFAPRPGNVLIGWDNIPDGTIYGQS